MYMLDTNICIYCQKNKPPQVLERLKQISSHEVCLSVITLAELIYGALKSQQVAHNLQKLNSLRSTIGVLPFDEKAAEMYGRIRTELEKRGEVIGANDLLIAAHALSIQATLVTNNLREFTRIAGLKLENWV